MKTYKILIACTNYNSNQKLTEYIESLLSSHYSLKDNIILTIIIADNSDNFRPIEFSFHPNFNIIHTRIGENAGYIGAIDRAVASYKIQLSSFDFIIISNVDLKVENDFFFSLTNLHITNDIGWIAPSIYSEKELKDRNPKILLRPTKKKLLFTILLYLHPLIHKIYTRHIYRNRKPITHPNNAAIYAGHGSFMIFTRNFFEGISSISFPSFLFGEEIFFAELVRLKNLKVIYSKDVKIIDSDHASTGNLKSKVYCKMNRDSLKSIIKAFF